MAAKDMEPQYDFLGITPIQGMLRFYTASVIFDPFENRGGLASVVAYEDLDDIGNRRLYSTTGPIQVPPSLENHLIPFVPICSALKHALEVMVPNIVVYTYSDRALHLWKSQVNTSDYRQSPFAKYRRAAVERGFDYRIEVPDMVNPYMIEALGLLDSTSP